ncbi:MAG: SusD/RagB family nutrient-binding outer membrane lipoprotein [Pedobacter sp.]|nr:MAG: SusD/RagB family nutrient-binding outer membrane lipoprotein [Pedobacter sp.]
MKKSIIYGALLATLFQAGCTKDFDEINTNPREVTEDKFDPNYLLSQSQWEFSNTGYSQLLFESMWPQVLASTFDYYGNGDKYTTSTNTINYQNALWDEEYRTASLIVEMQRLTKDKPNFSNLYHVGSLMKVMVMQRLTDVYGDVPYSEAFQAKTGLVQPKYDKQQDIYNSMLTEVEAAIAGLDATKPLPSADIFYKGNIAQWKKLGYSLMLKLAMRIVKADAATAKTWAEKAATGGTFTDIADNVKVKADNATGFGNGTTASLRTASDFLYVRWSKTFIDYLKITADPRIPAIAEVSQPGLVANGNQDLPGNNTAAIQVGLPNGRDLSGGATDVTKHPNYPGPSGTGSDIAVLGNYSRPRVAVYLDRSGWNFLFTYAETEFLLAEAKVRGWNVGATTAAVHYANGVRAAMKSIEQFNAAGAISDGAVATYIAANPLNVTSAENSIKAINEQYWVATGTLFNFIETWTNWRRSGYPVLTPVVYANNFSGGTIPRRIPYHASEVAQNPTNYQAAIAGLTPGDRFNARVWWDK